MEGVSEVQICRDFPLRTNEREVAREPQGNSSQAKSYAAGLLLDV
jgi:hypothetical protein